MWLSFLLFLMPELVQRFQYDVPVYTSQECPVCRATAAASKESTSSLHRNASMVDAMATHVAAVLPAKMPLELYGGIEDDEFFNHLHGILTKQFSPFVGAFLLHSLLSLLTEIELLLISATVIRCFSPCLCGPLRDQGGFRH